MTWSERVAEVLGQPAWDDAEATAVLDLARDIAHGVERKFAPLTTYAIGIAVGRALADDTLTSEARRTILDQIAPAMLTAVKDQS